MLIINATTPMLMAKRQSCALRLMALRTYSCSPQSRETQEQV
jgi:hypothetical protein